MGRFLSIGQAAEMLGVAQSTLRRWDEEGKLVPERTPGGQRRYSLEQISSYNPLVEKKRSPSRLTINYARVSSSEQEPDLRRQVEMLELFSAARGWKFETIQDVGSGMNYKKKGLNILIERLLNNEVERIVLTHKDRLLRFGAELIFAICEHKNTDVVVISDNDHPTFEEELANDVLEIVTVFSARLHGARSKRHKDLVQTMREAVSMGEGAQD